MTHDEARPPRREFLGKLGVLTVAAALPAEVARAEAAHRGRAGSPWDMSWVERVTAAPYKVAIDTTKIENDELYTALDILDTFHEVYGGGGTKEPIQVVVVLRHFAAAMAQRDPMWERYGIGEERSVTDPET